MVLPNCLRSTIVDNTVMDSVAVVDCIRNLVENQKVKTKNVAASVSGHSVIIRKISMPLMTEEEVGLYRVGSRAIHSF
ncbi:MAG: pilus assembly protein PilM [Syntrophotaleaceae bacterium]